MQCDNRSTRHVLLTIAEAAHCTAAFDDTAKDFLFLPARRQHQIDLSGVKNKLNNMYGYEFLQ